MQLCGIIYRHRILNVLEYNFRVICVYFRFCGKIRLFFDLRFVYAIYRLQFCMILIWGCCEAFFLGDEYIVYYIQGLTSPTTAARESTMVYLRVIIIWERVQMLNFQYEKSDLCG